MKKVRCILLAGLLMALMCTSAMAAAVSIQRNDKTYTFCKTSGDYSVDGTYVVDGITFIIDGYQVTIKQDGKADDVRTLVDTVDEVAVVENMGSAMSSIEQKQPIATEQPIIPVPAKHMYAVTSEEGTEIIITVDEKQDVIMQGAMTEAVLSQSASLAQDQEKAVIYDNYAMAASSISDYTATEYNDGPREVDYSVYEQYGMSFDEATNVLSYQGKRVRIFSDAFPFTHPTDYQVATSLEMVDKEGVVDVIARRNDNFGLIGLYVLSQNDFDSRDITSYILPPSMTAVAESGDVTPSELKEIYGVYARLGLIYDESTNILSYQGQTVRDFTDVQQTNGEPMGNGRFSGMITGLSNDFGVIDVTTIRDYTKPDAEGNGTLTGLSVTPVK
ncbi:MAG: hypothetical protein GX096_02905 [Clostridiales bacterium]|nr:hypothetical protein [Clostridiales bacterium]